jgi:hypothetical protein
MSGLLHDRPFRRPSNLRAGRMARPQRVPGVGRGVQSGPKCEFLDHARHIDNGQSARLYLPVSVNRPE